jgi:hypothetical protein
MTPTWLATWPVDNPTLFTIVVVGLLVAIVVVLHWTLPQQLATTAAAIAVPFAFTVILNNVLAVSRDKEGRRWTLRQEHVHRLSAVFQADATNLAEVAQRSQTQGAPLLSRAHNPNASRDEMEARFSSDPLSADVVNHYREYAESKAALREAAEQQDREWANLVSTLKTMVDRAPAQYRDIVAGALVTKWVGLGPGMTVRSNEKEHFSSWSISISSSGGSGQGPAQPELLAAFAVFTDFRPDSNVSTQCANLTTRRGKIVNDANKLSSEARMLAERTTLVGDCESPARIVSHSLVVAKDAGQRPRNRRRLIAGPGAHARGKPRTVRS